MIFSKKNYIMYEVYILYVYEISKYTSRIFSLKKIYIFFFKFFYIK